MKDLLPAEFSSAWLLPLLLAVLLLAWLIIRWRRSSGRALSRALDTIAYERIENLLIPNTEGGEIHIDHLVLTSRGLLVVDVKDVEGTVFGSDRMENWTVISKNHRFTFANPQAPLYDRIAAVHQLVQDVPVAGRVVFLDKAEFTKGVPSMVCSVDELVEQYAEQDKAASEDKIEAFMPQWELIHNAGDALVTGRIVRRRPHF